MNPREDQSIRDYDVGSSTTSESKDTRQKPQVKDIEEEKEQYPTGKPKRIVIRARITHD
jgi:hypothetical protein